MNENMLLNILLYGNMFLALLTGVFFLFVLRQKNVQKWEKLPRAKYAGGILGFLALLAFIPNVEPMFPVEKYLGVLIAAAIILSVLCFLYIDHIFARALAGSLILLAHASLAESCAANIRFSSFFAVMVLLYGTIGILLAAKPYYLRELIRKCAGNLFWRYSVSIFAVIWFTASLLLFCGKRG